MGRRPSVVLVRRVPLAEALGLLAVGRRQFDRTLRGLFTETRDRPGHGAKVTLLEDELGVYLTEGRAALLMYRRRVGRLKG